ncbi:hypothetical protein EN875_032325 [Mesorhizobium sp. M2D.F.Ca.ET.232.01.1.1]|uniref:hypothetical protein n=1 Tax=Mesorhizobium sp. M2D.F.Ca.ET.232.01.1.1 TaxID=2496670 RepID=UPI000FCC4B21|nr:hypothetical protein [Mesorhizobium sp. M2D.F.Ca.ET.232.01.1.1]TGP28245.1 hypothetical protein EN875_032325 [Mesorhizobium sp. M2D.F.Ca.ET.232.01.1.1]
MIWFRPKRGTRVELTETDFKPDEIVVVSLLERSTQKVGDTLDRLRRDETDLERQIATLTEELRQTRVAITAFDAAGAILAGAAHDSHRPTPAGEVGRLVPRMPSEDQP